MRTIPWCIVALAAAFVAASRIEAAETEITPAVAIGEEYTDNLFLEPAMEVPEYIYHVIPSISARYLAPVWEWKAAYSYDARYYAKTRYDDKGTNNLALTSVTRIVPDQLFLQVRDDAGRISISPVRNFAVDSPLKNQTDFNTFEANPYAAFNLTSRTTLTTGYRYRNVTYEDPAAIDHSVQIVYGDISVKLSGRTDLNASLSNDWTATRLTDQNTSLSTGQTATLWHKRTRTNSLFGSRYEYGEQSFLWGRVGISLATYDEDRRETHPTWDAGIIHRMNSTTLSVETGRSWIEDPYLAERREDRYLATLRTETERTSAGMSIAVREYGLDRKTIDERKYSLSADLAHFLTTRLQARFGMALDRYKSYSTYAPDANARVRHADVRLEHHASDSVTVALDYRYTDSDSPDPFGETYEVNRVLLEVKKIF